MNVAIALASAADDAGVRRLVRDQTMPGRVRLAFCREPDFSIGCAVTGDDSRILVARSVPDGDVVGVACRSIRRVFLNGRARRIGYLGQLRVDQRYRGRWLVSRGFAMLEAMHREDPLPAYLASIVDGNDEATGVLVRRPRRGFPEFREAARYVTVAIRVRRASRWDSSSAFAKASASTMLRRTRRSLGAAGTADRRSLTGDAAGQPSIEEIAGFLRREGPRRQLSPVWTADSLRRLAAYGLTVDDIRIARRDGAITGVIALWDQSAYKQSVIRGYSGWLRAAAPLLPRPGTELRSAYASLICVANDDPVVFESLLRDVCASAAARGLEYVLVGLDARDPLLEVARAHPHIAYPSRLYLASWPEGGPSYEPLDARPAYLDIATL
jgi:hypothetical protein